MAELTITDITVPNNIPRVIHQTLPDKHRIVSSIADNIARLQAMNPGWRHVLHDNDDIPRYISAHFDADVLQAYNSINPLYGAARADFFRYLLIYNEGGVYLDVKSGCKQPLDDVILPTDELLLARWDNAPGGKFEGWGRHIDDGVPSELQNWHVIARPRHPLMLAAVEAVLRNLRNYAMRTHGVGKFGVLRTTGPLAYTKAIEPLLAQHPHRFFDSDAAGLVYVALVLPPGQSSHMGLFKQHYTRVKMPLVSSGPQRPWHYARYKALRLLGLMR
ncbi:MAG: glycosyltransferase [Aquabacterium commune]|uniref:glycosyltransferase family 32 protein n=1 Tax=Aquabacterium commune TaxID=70586 RepID=UPI003BAFE2FD